MIMVVHTKRHEPLNIRLATAVALVFAGLFISICIAEGYGFHCERLLRAGSVCYNVTSLPWGQAATPCPSALSRKGRRWQESRRERSTKFRSLMPVGMVSRRNYRGNGRGPCRTNGRACSGG